jgi:hypothetical protein
MITATPQTTASDVLLTTLSTVALNSLIFQHCFHSGGASIQAGIAVIHLKDDKCWPDQNYAAIHSVVQSAHSVAKDQGTQLSSEGLVQEQCLNANKLHLEQQGMSVSSINTLN